MNNERTRFGPRATRGQGAMRRLHRAVAIVFGVTSLAVGGLTSQASAVEYWVSGPNTCPVAVGTVPNAYCVYKSRTSSSNIQGYYYAGDANLNETTSRKAEPR